MAFLDEKSLSKDRIKGYHERDIPFVSYCRLRLIGTGSV